MTTRTPSSRVARTMDIRLHRAEERRLMRGFVLSLAALLAGTLAVALLMWWANLWIARTRPSATSSAPPVVAESVARVATGGA